MQDSLLRRRQPDIRLRRPTAKDGAAVNKLIAACKPLDPNSIYCNLLQCTHFADTSMIALLDDEVCGFVSGYRKPDAADVLFIWQVAVHERVRGRRLGMAMIDHVLERPANADVRHIETSISPDNAASWALFRSVARERDASLTSRPWFSSGLHFDRNHDDEVLVRIGPFQAGQWAACSITLQRSSP